MPAELIVLWVGSKEQSTLILSLIALMQNKLATDYIQEIGENNII